MITVYNLEHLQLLVNDLKIPVSADFYCLDIDQEVYIDMSNKTIKFSKLNRLYNTRGIFSGGHSYTVNNDLNSIEYINISVVNSSGNNFGILTSGKKSYHKSCSDGIKGVIGPGDSNSSIDYITISTPNECRNFGSALEDIASYASISNGIKGLFIDGKVGTGWYTQKIEYLTITTPGYINFFGSSDSNFSHEDFDAVSNGILGIYGGGYDQKNNTTSQYLEKITISTPSNGILSLILPENKLIYYSISNDVRGIFGRGNSTSNMYYVTISTPNICMLFSSYSTNYTLSAAASDGIRGIISGGTDGSNTYNTINYITISTPADAQLFGSLYTERDTHSGMSGSKDISSYN